MAERGVEIDQVGAVYFLDEYDRNPYDARHVDDRAGTCRQARCFARTDIPCPEAVTCYRSSSDQSIRGAISFSIRVFLEPAL